MYRSWPDSCSASNLDHPLLLQNLRHHAPLQVRPQERSHQHPVSRLHTDSDEHRVRQAG